LFLFSANGLIGWEDSVRWDQSLIFGEFSRVARRAAGVSRLVRGPQGDFAPARMKMVMS
jgi:hypothetical protein